MESLNLLLKVQDTEDYVWDTGTAYNGQPFLTDEITGVQTLESKKKDKRNEGTEQLLQISGAEGNSDFLWTDSAGLFVIDTEKMKAFQGGYVYLKPMLSKEFKPALELTDFFPRIDSIRKRRPDCYPVADLSNYKKEQILDLPVISSDSVILLNEVTVTAKGHKPFRDKMMGRLDSLARLDMNGAYVCGCGFLQNYMPGYDAHPHWKSGTCQEKKSQPVEGETYTMVKYKHLGGDAFEVEEYRNVTYHGSVYSEEELLTMNNLWRTKGYYGEREFYQPDEIDMQLSIPDARNTLLWAPSVITDEKGEATVSFHCSDINAVFTGVVEGVDGGGLLGTANCEFRVIRK
jgi:hypothetical protein